MDDIRIEREYNFISDTPPYPREGNTEMDLVYEALDKLWHIMEFENDGTSRLVDFLRFCTVAKTSVGTSVTYSTSVASTKPSVDDVVVISSEDLSQEEEKDRFPWLNVTNLNECDVAERQLKIYIDDVILGPYGHIKRHQKFFYLAYAYYDRHLYASECFTLIEEGKRSLSYFWAVLDLIYSVSQGNLVAMNNLTYFLTILPFPKSIDKFDARLQKAC